MPSDFGEWRRNEMADCCENFFVKIEPKHIYYKNGGSADEKSVDVNVGLCT